MSYFLCLALPQEVAPKLASTFDNRIHLTDASNLPIGQTTRGKNRSWTAYLLQVGSSSASLIGKRAVKKTHNSDKSDLLVSGIVTLMEDEACPSVAILCHWMHGYIATETVTIQEERNIQIADLIEAIPDLEEDVCYVVNKL